MGRAFVEFHFGKIEDLLDEGGHSEVERFLARRSAVARVSVGEVFGGKDVTILAASFQFGTLAVVEDFISVVSVSFGNDEVGIVISGPRGGGRRRYFRRRGAWRVVMMLLRWKSR